MAASFVQMKPDDTGKKLRTYADAVPSHAQYMIFTDERLKSGVFTANTGYHQISASAHGATNGYWWLLNPLASGFLISFEYIHMMGQLDTGATVFATSPRITLERCTFTGGLSGNLIVPADRLSAEVTQA